VEFFRPCDTSSRRWRFDPGRPDEAWKQFTWKVNHLAHALRFNDRAGGTVRPPEPTTDELWAGYEKWQKEGIPKRGRAEVKEHNDD
jgi:hypothetical protein